MNRAAITTAIIAGLLGSSSTFVLADNYYFRVKAPTLGLVKELDVVVSGDSVGMIGRQVSGQVSITKGQGPFQFTVSSGSLPAGVSLNQNTGEISGVPQVAGDYSATILVNGAPGSKGSAAYPLHINEILQLSHLSPQTIVIGDPYSKTFTATGGDGKYSWALSGSLPDGLTFSNGTISGTPNKTGSFQGLTVSVKDGTGIEQTSSFSIDVIDLTKTVSSSQSNLTLSSLFTASEWQSSRPKRVVIPSGVVVYSSTPTSAALSSGTNWSGKLTLQIDAGAEVQGAAGIGGAAADGRNGGDAIAAQFSGLSIINNGAVRAGGGGGGAGGQGAAGSISIQAREPETGALLSTSPRYGCWNDQTSNNWYWNDIQVVGINSGYQYPAAYGGSYLYYCGTDSIQFNGGTLRAIYRVANTATDQTTNGGSGGAGGDGRGFNHSSSVGAAGTAGGQNAGAGGAGGKGGDWGQAGADGTAGQQSNTLSQGAAGFKGGSPGHAINGSVTYSGAGVKQGL